ncbi:MAG TPA: glycosyltransferase family 61 protein [Xanthobacteraceae bacterium]|jgi:hypothetical protein|nr:glycosyltransferase family 61 protein [Xanthobacteraceae bacterium]
MVFKRVSIQAPELMAPSDGSTPRVRRGAQIFPAATLAIPAIEFGDVNPASLDVRDELGLWKNGPMPIAEVHAFEVYDAVVHPPMGVITVGEFVLQETLAHLPVHLPGYGMVGNEVQFPIVPKNLEIGHGLHAMGGNSGNYFHWLLEIVPRLQVGPFAPSLTDGMVLLSSLETKPQIDVMALFGANRNPLLVQGSDYSIHLSSLLFVPNLAGYGFTPNPHLRSFFSRLKTLLDVDANPHRRIYVSRRDSKNRAMRNEQEVETLVKEFGYEIVELTGLSLKEQAALFASASHVVAPHGAGVANIIFCKEGTTLCELHMSNYLNPCFRRLAGVQHMRYGCLVGKTDRTGEQPDWPHGMPWTAPVDRLEAVLSQIA